MAARMLRIRRLPTIEVRKALVATVQPAILCYMK